MANNLFEEFEAVSTKQWKQQIQFELKGANYNDTLIWDSPEDIKVKPFYDASDLDKIVSVTTKATEFKICQNIAKSDLYRMCLPCQERDCAS